MRKSIIVPGFILLAALLAACGDDPPPTQIVIVVTATPDATTSAQPGTETANSHDSAPLPTDTDELRPTDTDEPRPTDTDEPEPTRTPNPMLPTNVYAEYQLAEQIFEHGRMFWIRHSREIWVMLNDPDNTDRGEWYCYQDTFNESEPEIDPDLIPPDGLYQPRRGFGKLWRENPAIKDTLGWATTPEFELTSNYTYIASGPLDDEGNPTTPGESRLTTLYGETITFFESEVRGDCTGGRWRLSQ